MTQAAKMTQLAIAALEDKKAEDITLIDIAKVSVLADYFLIANGNNRNQVQAMADNVDEQLTKAGYSLKSMEGYPTGIFAVALARFRACLMMTVLRSISFNVAETSV